MARRESCQRATCRKYKADDNRAVLKSMASGRSTKSAPVGPSVDTQ